MINTQETSPLLLDENMHHDVGPPPHQHNEERDFIEDNTVGLLLSALASGFLVGVALLIVQQRTQRSPAEEVRHGSRALLAGAVVGTAAYFSSMRKRAAEILPRAATQARRFAGRARKAVGRAVSYFR
jgi:hypothetical protein